MIIDDSIRDKVSGTAYDTWKDAALADLADMLCISDLAQSTTDMTGVVSDDGKHVILPAWYSNVTGVKSTYDTSLGYTIEYAKSDGLTPETKYAKTLTLTTPYLPGMTVTITGIHGFATLPNPLTGILAAIIQADQSIADRSDSIASKRIEDVSVTYASNGQTTLERSLAPYKALISSWTLCPIRSDTGGCLDMPTPRHDLPWWINTQDYLGGDYTYGTAM